MGGGQIFFYPALKFWSNCPHATANFALAKIKFATASHKRPCRNMSNLLSFIQGSTNPESITIIKEKIHNSKPQKIPPQTPKV
jgi:hypothetical protein